MTDPLSALLKLRDTNNVSAVANCKSPSSVTSEDGRAAETASLAASFVFVESAPLRRQPTVLLAPATAVDTNCASMLTQPVLISGEVKQAFFPKSFLISAPTTPLTLLVTTYRLLLCDATTGCVHTEIPNASVLDLKSRTLTPTTSLSRLSSSANSATSASSSFSLNGSSGEGVVGIDVKTKDCRFFQLQIEVGGNEGSKNGFLKLLQTLFFSWTDHIGSSAAAQRTPALYSPEAELRRLGLDHKLQVSEGNSEFGICSTYPKKLLVPSSASLAVLTGSSRFRDKGRFPVCSWGCAVSGATVWRSSQPKSSLLNRSGEDEEYLRQTGVMYIIDCRPMLNAYANIANGAGVESLGNYHSGVELWFASIHNIHHVRDAWEKMFLLAQQPALGAGPWYAGLEASGWYEYICSILRASSVLVEKVKSGVSVLCRCSHGLDRTPQVVSTAMLALDPFYRTARGFLTLVEKEWITMGHKFHSRNCFGQSPSDEFSPIFTQWVECVYQLMVRDPNFFHFTPNFLVTVWYTALSGRFSNFLFDFDKERAELVNEDGVAASAWPYLLAESEKAENRNLNALNEAGTIEIDFRVSSTSVFHQVWFNSSQRPHTSIS